MASRAAVQRLRHEVMASGRWTLLSFRERGVWHHLHAEATTSPEPGRVEFIGPFLPALARVVGLAEEEVTEAVRILREARLMDLEEGGTAAWLAGARPQPVSDRKRAANQANGRKGGRPKRGADRRQQHFKLPIRGRLVVRAGTQTGNPPESHGETQAQNPPLGGPSVSPSVPGNSRGSREEEDSKNLAVNPPSSSSSHARASADAGPGETQTETQAQNPRPVDEDVTKEVAGFVHDELRMDQVPTSQVRQWLGKGIPPDVIRLAATRTKASLKPGERVRSASIVESRIEALIRERARGVPASADKTAGRSDEERAWIKADSERWAQEWVLHREGKGPFPAPKRPWPGKAA